MSTSTSASGSAGGKDGVGVRAGEGEAMRAGESRTARAAAASTERLEREFEPATERRSQVLFGLGLLGSAALGAAVYGAWFASDAVSGSTALFVGGLVALAAALSLAPRRVPPVRVGELGVMFGDPPEAPRVPWCEVRSVRLLEQELRLEATGADLRLPLPAHALAATRIIAEASRRIAERVDVSPKAHERLSPPSDADGRLVPAGRLQLAGRKCAASGTSITFESDARLCDNCAALYHAAHVPERCVRCERALAR